MIKQIEESIEFDCWTEERHDLICGKPVLLTGSRWQNNEIDRIKKSIEYHTKENADEIKRVDGRNKWIRELRESLQGCEE